MYSHHLEEGPSISDIRAMSSTNVVNVLKVVYDLFVMIFSNMSKLMVTFISKQKLRKKIDPKRYVARKLLVISSVIQCPVNS